MAMLCPFQGRMASAGCPQFPQVRFRILFSRCCSGVRGMVLLSPSLLFSTDCILLSCSGSQTDGHSGCLRMMVGDPAAAAETMDEALRILRSGL